MYVQDLLELNVSRNVRYDIVSIYDTLISSLFINYLPHKQFCGPSLYDTTYDTSTIASLMIGGSTPRKLRALNCGMAVFIGFVPRHFGVAGGSTAVQLVELSLPT
jgi:hypothetical protein